MLREGRAVRVGLLDQVEEARVVEEQLGEHLGLGLGLGLGVQGEGEMLGATPRKGRVRGRVNRHVVVGYGYG